MKTFLDLELEQVLKMKTVKILSLISVALFIASGCTEQYAGNPQLGALYRILNYDTTYKERALFFEMEDHSKLTSDGKFYIMGAGISNPGSYSCGQNENILSAIEKAGQAASYSEMSFTIIKGIRDNEREIRGLVMICSFSGAPVVSPGDLICLNATPATVALSQK